MTGITVLRQRCLLQASKYGRRFNQQQLRFRARLFFQKPYYY